MIEALASLATRVFTTFVANDASGKRSENYDDRMMNLTNHVG